ncbi:MAG: ATP-binding protein [Dehalococcoidales bacterium]|nr:ATP-binding protein [Dehalococcoidales bacterium]
MNQKAAPNAMDGLRGALLRLDLRLRLAVDGTRTELAERARDPFRGLCISEAEVDELLAGVPPAEAARALLAAAPAAATPRLGSLAALFGLNQAAQEVLLICLAPELDLRYERLYAYLQDDVGKRRPTADLVLRLLCRSFEERVAARSLFSPITPLLGEGLLQLADENAATWPLLARPLRVDERVVSYLLGGRELDTRLDDWVRLFPPPPAAEVPAPANEAVESLAQLLRAARQEPCDRLVVYLQGPPGSAKLATAWAACAAAGLGMLAVDLPALVGRGQPENGLALAGREALLQGVVLALDGLDRLLGDDERALPWRAGARRLLERRPGSTILLGEARWEPAVWAPLAGAVRVELTSLGPAARLRLWHDEARTELSPEDLANLASRFRLDGEAVRAVTIAARGRARWRGQGPALLEDFRAAARVVAAPQMENLARRIEPRYAWDDIVLPLDGHARLRELCDRARYHATVLDDWGFGRKHARRTGVTALFAGEPGTGKTMAAEIIAGELGMDLYRIDLSAVVSKYIGETEKNLERIFRAADQGDAVLLFDEADALFGKRSEVRDAHDRYANVEIAYLLQRLEAYDGLAILTTNLRGNVDEAFMRRLDCVLEFPLPEEEERLAIWRRVLPPEAPLASDVDLPFLARRFKLSGGHIRNIALAAAFLAAPEAGQITMRHLVRATRREHQKLGRLMAERDFDQYAPLLGGA